MEASTGHCLMSSVVGAIPLRARAREKGKSQPLAALTWEDERVDAVMGLVQYHEGEYRHWHKAWGLVLGGHYNYMDWQRYRGPAPGHPFFCHHQLQLQPVTSALHTFDDFEECCRPDVGGRI